MTGDGASLAEEAGESRELWVLSVVEATDDGSGFKGTGLPDAMAFSLASLSARDDVGRAEPDAALPGNGTRPAGAIE